MMFHLTILFWNDLYNKLQTTTLNPGHLFATSSPWSCANHQCEGLSVFMLLVLRAYCAASLLLLYAVVPILAY